MAIFIFSTNDGVTNNVVLVVDMSRPSGAALIILHVWNSITLETRQDEILHLENELRLVQDLRRCHIL